MGENYNDSGRRTKLATELETTATRRAGFAEDIAAQQAAQDVQIKLIQETLAKNPELKAALESMRSHAAFDQIIGGTPPEEVWREYDPKSMKIKSIDDIRKARQLLQSDEVK